MNDRTSWRRRLTAGSPPLVAFLLAAVVTGCDLLPFGQSEAGFETVRFQNNTTQTVSVAYRSPAGVESVVVSAIGPGQVGSNDGVAGGGCTTGVLIARSEAGKEVARRSEPLCLGDTWSIEGDGTASPSTAP